MAVPRTSRVIIALMGIAVGLLIAIPCSLSAGANDTHVSLTLPPDELHLQGRSLWLAIPECDNASLNVDCGGHLISGTLIETAYVRDQKIGLFELAEDLTPAEEVGVDIGFVGSRGAQCVDAGPLTRVLNQALAGYGVPPAPAFNPGIGSVARCQNLSQCAAAVPDILLVAGHALFTSAYVDSMAQLWAVRMGLNVAIIDAASISTTSAVALRDFIASLYNLKCAEHFGDGHLGFVVLLGDAFEDDNLTRMVPDYDGYGGTQEASDHYYACVAGSDDFEDLMLGRIPAGNLQELVNYYAKVSIYTPVPAAEWAKSLLLIGGCFFASKTDYADLFDRLEAVVTQDFHVSRWYRYDYPLTSVGDGLACQAVVDSLHKGFLFALYCGDGDKWDWGGTTKRAFRSADIASLGNGSNLPIVLSIACSNGCFDNTSLTYGDGGVDCLAERMLVAPGKGAVGCLAAGRDVGGGAATVFAPEIMKSAFVNGSSFLGELVLEAKTRHLLDLGSVAYVRQFNLFGDPCLNFILNDYAMALPDLVIRPYRLKVTPEFPRPQGPLTLTGEVWNASGSYVNSVDVAVFAGPPDSGGTQVDHQILTVLYPWEKRSVQFSIAGLAVGSLNLYLVADASHSVAEVDETNNIAGTSTYIYPCQDGFPLKVDDDVRGQVIADLNGDGLPEILVTSGASMAEVIDISGRTVWVRKDLGMALQYEGVEPAAADLVGDGTTECVIPIKSGVMVVDGATGTTRWKNYTDNPCLSPITADLDGDGTLEVLLGTYTVTYSKIMAFEASGATRWTHSVPGTSERLTGIVLCDITLDGKKEIAYSTSKGTVRGLTCQVEPPTVAWARTLSSQAITSIVAGDLDRDGTVEIIASHDSTITILDAADGHTVDEIRVSPCQWSLALGDADGDGTLEIVCGSSCGEIGMIDNGAMVLDYTLDGTPYRSPVLADLDGDGRCEVIFATQEGTIRIIDLQGTNLIAPIPMKGSCLVTPVVGDIDADSHVEVVAGSIDSLLFVCDLGTQGTGTEWPCAAGSPERTGLYAQPLFGTISTDLTLTGRLDAVGDILVPAGKTLTLERGSSVRLVRDDVSPVGSALGQCEVIVAGHLVARGTPNCRTVLGPSALPPASGRWLGIVVRPGASASLTQTEISGALSAVECQSSDVTISECTLRNSSIGLKITSSSPLIDGNLFTSDDYGISASGGQPTIVSNTITSCISGGIILSSACNATLSSNVVSRTSQGNGLSVYSSAPTIGAGNRFEMNSLCGIYLSSSSPAIDSCWVGYNGDCGLKVMYYSNPVVRRTSLVANKYGVAVYMNSSPVLGDSATGRGMLNDIRQNTAYAVYNKTTTKLKAHRNWWGGPALPSMFVGQVDYSGWLVTPPSGTETGRGGTSLVQAVYPNPFSRSVRFSLMIADDARPVTVDIYDVAGRLIRNLALAAGAGKVTVEWDGRDMFGNPAASGTYFVSIASRGANQTRKVVLLH